MTRSTGRAAKADSDDAPRSAATAANGPHGEPPTAILGSPLKAYDGVSVRCPPRPIRCSRLDAEGANELGLTVEPAWCEIGRLPGGRPRSLEVFGEPSYPAHRFLNPVGPKGALGHSVAYRALDLSQLSIRVLGPEAEQIAAGCQRSDGRPGHPQRAGGARHIEGVTHHHTGEAQLPAQQLVQHDSTHCRRTVPIQLRHQDVGGHDNPAVLP